MVERKARLEKKECKNEIFENQIATFGRTYPEFIHEGEELNERLIEEVAKRIKGVRTAIPTI